MADTLSEAEAVEGRRLVEQSERASRLDEVTAEIGIMRLQQSGLESQLSSQAENQASVYTYLQKKWVDSAEQLAALTAKVAADEAALAAKRERVGAEAAQAAQRDGAAMAEAQSKVDALIAEKALLERFNGEKALLEDRCQKLLETVERRRKAHSDSLEMLDQKNQIERERLQAEMEMRIGETTRSIESHAKAMLPDSTKRTMMDIEKIGTELDYQSHEVKKLRERCDKIEGDNAKLKSQLVQAQREESVAARRLHQRQREYKRMAREEKAAAAAAAAAGEEEEKGSGGLGRRGKGGEKGAAAASAKRRRDDQARQQQTQGSSHNKKGASGGGGGGGGGNSSSSNNEALLERLLAQLDASERQAAELEPQQTALTADLDRLLLAQDKLTQVVLAAVRDALGDPSVLRQVAARLQHKQRQQGNNGGGVSGGGFGSSNNQQQSQYADNNNNNSSNNNNNNNNGVPERRDSADDSLSWVSDDNTVASSAALSLGDLSSLTAVGHQQGGGRGAGSKQGGRQSPWQSRQLRYVAAEHLEAPQRWHVLGLVLARVHNLQLEGIAAVGNNNSNAAAAAAGSAAGKHAGKGKGDDSDAPESSLPAIV